MKKKVLNRGFTLIELLVVIAIIGILSSIVLISLNVARSKAADAKVRAQLSGARNSAEIYHDQNSVYNGTAGDITSDCTVADSMFTDTVSGMSQYTDIANNYPPFTTISCYSTDGEYAMSASLSDPAEFWCIDSTGVSMQTAAHVDDTTCL